MRLFSVIFICLFLPVKGFGQNEMLDSIKQKMYLQTGAEKINTLLSLSYFMYEYSINDAHQMALEAFDAAHKSGNPLQEKFALSLIGEYFYNISDFKTARNFFRQSDQINVKGAFDQAGYNYVLWANTYRLESQYDSAIFYYSLGIPLLEKGGNSDFIHYAYISNAGLLMDRYQLEEARNMLEKAMILAQRNNQSEQLADVFIEEGRLENLSDNYDKAKSLLLKANDLIPSQNYSYLRLICIYNLGFVEYNLGNYTAAISYLQDILSRKEVEQYEDIIANINALVGKIYMERDEFNQALKSFFDAAKVMERLHMKRELGQNYANIAWLYFKQFNDVEAVNFINKALKVGNEIGDDMLISHAYSIQGSIYTAQNKYPLAIQEHQKALKIRKRIQTRAGIADTYYNLSTVYEKMGQIDQALFYAMQSLSMDETMGNIKSLGLSNKRIASLYLLKQEYRLALPFLEKADNYAAKAKSLELRRDVDMLRAEWYEKNGDLKSANELLRNAVRSNDSLYNEANLGKTAEIRGLFDLENIESKSVQRDRELELQQAEMEIQQNRYLLVTISLLLVSLFLIFGAFLYVNSRKINAKLMTEISEKKKAEDQLLKSQISLEEAQALAQVGSWEFNLLTYDLNWSKETYHIFELENHPLEGLYEAWQQKCHPDDRLKLDRAINNTIQTGEPFHVEHRMICNNGDIKYISCICEAIKDDTGKVIGLKGADQDITLHKQAELAKSEFLSSMSHEIRTPINGVIGISNLLIDENLTEVQRGYVKTLKFSAQHLSSVVSDILDFSKIESGNLVFENVPFDLKEVATNVFNLFENKALEKNLQFEFIPDPSINFLLSGDYVRLSQILSNLLSNAIKFTDSGNVTFAYSLKEKMENSLTVVFTVKDMGIGIDPKQLDMIFENFTQADISISRKYGGTGLGLAICKKLVEAQGGKIAVESALGQGCLFTVELTYEQHLAAPEQAIPAASVSANNTDLLGMKILVAEDNNVNVLVLTLLLKKWGTAYTVAKDGREAIDYVQNEDFDAIIMDIQMPEISGMEATLIIRAMTDKHKRDIPIIAFTAEASVESYQHFLSAGFNDCMSKPFQPDQMFNMLKKYYHG